MTARWVVMLSCLFLNLFAAGGQAVLIPPATYAVEGMPYTASIEEDRDATETLPARHSSSRVLRDGAGRQRTETLFGDVQRVVIRDVVAGKIIALDANAKVARISTMNEANGAARRPASSRSVCGPTPGFEQLGTKQIAGQEACGQVREGVELWRSVKFGIPLEAYFNHPPMGRERKRVTEFTAAEPDPTLFQIPEGYRTEVVENKPDAAGVYKIGNGVSAPVVLKAPEPEFSEEARRKQMSGTVQVTLEVGQDGLPRNVRVSRGFGHGLDEAAVDAVRQYKFKPAMKDGVPVEVTLRVEVNFQIFRKP